MTGQCRTGIQGFSSFPAVSLPRLRFDRRVACKVLIRNDFRYRANLKKIFTLSFPARQGKGEVALPCRLCCRPRTPVQSEGLIGSGLTIIYRRIVYYGSASAATRPLLAAVGDAMSQPVSHSKPPGKPTTIMHMPNNSEAASAASAE